MFTNLFSMVVNQFDDTTANNIGFLFNECRWTTVVGMAVAGLCQIVAVL